MDWSSARCEEELTNGRGRRGREVVDDDFVDVVYSFMLRDVLWKTLLEDEVLRLRCS